MRTGDWPFDIGLRVEDGLLRAQAMAVDAAHALEPRQFLHWNRSTRLVRFACTKSGDVWVHGDLPVACVDEQAVDRLLGLMAEAAAIARSTPNS